MTYKDTTQSNKPKPENYDLIVIGAGLGALTAAAIAARRGQRVLVVEKHKVLGGYASVFARKGITFDVSLHQIGGVGHTRVREILEEAGVYEKLEFVKSPSLSALYLGEKKPVLSIPNGDGCEFQQMLYKMFPQDRSAIWLWFWIMRRFGRQIGYWDNVRRGGAFRQGATIFFAPILAPFLFISHITLPKIAMVLRTKNPELRKILLHFSGYYGSPAHEINILYPMAANFSYYYDGGYYLKGGGYAIIRQMSLVVKKHGGTILTGKTIKSIRTKNNRVIGVELQDNNNTRFDAPKIVCGANPFTVYGHLLQNNQIAQKQYKQISNMDVGMTASVLYIKINVPVEHLNPKLEAVYEFVEPPAEDEASYYKRFRTRGFEEGYEHDGLNLTIHSTADPDALKGEGGALLDIFFCDNYDRWHNLSGNAYQAQKEIEIQKMLDAIEKHLPNLRDHIEIIEMATPKTMEKFTSNHRGAIYGFSQLVSQSLRRRFSIRSPIKGLNFVSAWSNPGGGYEGVLRSADTYCNPITWKGIAVFVGLIAASTQISTIVHALFG